VRVFYTRVQGLLYDDIGRVDAICSKHIPANECVDELKNQACKLGGDIVYDVPDEPEKPSPDKVRYTGRVAHSKSQPVK
jgi:hypothetical protein